MKTFKDRLTYAVQQKYGSIEAFLKGLGSRLKLKTGFSRDTYNSWLKRSTLGRQEKIVLELLEIEKSWLFEGIGEGPGATPKGSVPRLKNYYDLSKNGIYELQNLEKSPIYMEFPSSVNKDNVISLQAKDNQLSPRILAGDEVFIELDAPIDEGIGFVEINGSRSLKRVQVLPNSIRLSVDSPEFSPIEIETEDPSFLFLGRVVGIYHRCVN